MASTTAFVNSRAWSMTDLGTGDLMGSAGRVVVPDLCIRPAVLAFKV